MPVSNEMLLLGANMCGLCIRYDTTIVSGQCSLYAAAKRIFLPEAVELT